ncbi:FAD binding domain-containing protein [Streptomyces melanosporofaciens]|uniref:Xanthine dehydrogenase YagS FAD-binding subunit n=1 Tax=Streptomyces melanosporofaciens TaxID=67327 RepID=A0A1H5CC48_STRMJ|nr:FAD binding domain-containing protein [Streptomyces melanosporofaciens]SED63900.1 xanthine dehydrogenase YagS FAD-binding subunit [Streptomyces melanosporofaciens]
MHPFSFTRARTIDAALAAGARGGRYLAGGTTLVDLMRETVERPSSIVDINDLPLHEVSATSSGLRIGALARMSDVAAHPAVRTRYPAIAQALELSASAQLRNAASIGGNLMQRTRCAYFRDVSASCNKREPGTGCAALRGHNRTHAILGTSEACVATHPSDLAVALLALDAVIHLRSRAGARSVPVADFLLRPGTTPEREHDIRPGELITAVDVPAAAHTRTSGYLKVRDRQSYEFALASAAVALHIEKDVIRSARVAVGGVATVPWRLPAVEHRLLGARPSRQLWADAAAKAADGARLLRHNAFKAELLQRTVARQLGTIGGRK